MRQRLAPITDSSRRIEDLGEARWMLMAGETRVLGKGGIEFRTEIYMPDRLSGLAGVELDVRYMPHDLRTIELYHEGKWLPAAGRVTGPRPTEGRRALIDRARRVRKSWLR